MTYREMNAEKVCEIYDKYCRKIQCSGNCKFSVGNCCFRPDDKESVEERNYDLACDDFKNSITREEYDRIMDTEYDEDEEEYFKNLLREHPYFDYNSIDDLRKQVAFLEERLRKYESR